MIWNNAMDYGFEIIGYTDEGEPLAVECRPDGWHYDDINPDTGEIETRPCSEAKARKLLAASERAQQVQDIIDHDYT